jgi:uridine kinase
MNHNELSQFLINKLNNNSILRIAGYPSCGKTTLSNKIKSKVNNCIIIEAEHWIYSLEHRKRINLSGSNPKSYNIGQCVKDIEKLLKNRKLELNVYSHLKGDHDRTKTVELNPNDIIILDGTIFSLPDFDFLSKNCYSLYPGDYEKWIAHVVNRDINERYFTKNEAIQHNRRKYDDMLELNNSDYCFFIKCIHESTFNYSLNGARTK